MSSLNAAEKLFNQSAALATYRHLLRATKIAFAGTQNPTRKLVVPTPILTH